MNRIIFIVGMPGAGKSIVSDELVTNGFAFVRFGQITLDKVKEQGLEPTEENEKNIREGFRKEYGMAAYALLNIPKFDELLKVSNVVGDGLYSWSEYKILKEKYGKLMRVIAVYAPPELRHKRLSERKVLNDPKMRFRSFTLAEAKARDYAEIENIEKGGPIAMADFTIINIGSVEELRQEVKNILREINDKN
jgi:dephospho-CoA kinase